MLGASEISVDMLSGCSETATNKKIEADEKRDIYVTQKKEANVKAIKEAAQKKKTDGLKVLLGPLGQAGERGEIMLAEDTISAFEVYRLKAVRLAEKDKVSELDTIMLERAKNDFDAI